MLLLKDTDEEITKPETLQPENIPLFAKRINPQQQDNCHHRHYYHCKSWSLKSRRAILILQGRARRTAKDWQTLLMASLRVVRAKEPRLSRHFVNAEISLIWNLGNINAFPAVTYWSEWCGCLPACLSFVLITDAMGTLPASLIWNSGVARIINFANRG